MTTALASLQGRLNPLKNIDPKDVLARYLAEETSTEIAKSLGVTKSALSYWLLHKAETEWRSAQVVKALKRKEDAELALESAPNALDLARARELLRAAQWDLERVCKRIYGQESIPTGANIQINIGIARQQKQENSTESVQVIDVPANAADS
jgi:hypothetical protein